MPEGGEVVTDTMAVTRATLEQAWPCIEWLNEEAALLDANKMREWLELLDSEVDYRLPIRVTRERPKGLGFSAEGYHMYEDFESLRVRVERLYGEYAWAEDPPSRTRRLVSNVRVSVARSDEYEVLSNLLIFRSRLDAIEYELIAGERHDLLIEVAGGLKLRRRLILLDHSTLANKNLALFF
jgi:3-phenylpropionate/cinnamic acid dioxygenase small subunit